MAVIRECTKQDFDQIVKLLGQLWPDASLNIEDLKKIYQKGLKSDSEYYLCATIGSDIIGFCTLAVNNSLWQQGQLGCIEELVVDEAHRGKGIGSELLTRIMETAKLKGCRGIVLDSAFHREASHRFYEKRGFVSEAYHFWKKL
ncbi:MAG: GNAT family N-acetyltransferase [Gemmatimonadota bacterium]|nr:MAG: GNAT family N-acetyltransferase [Gemmatimonadota bacterium]